MNKISYLSGSIYSLEEKICIKELGRPLPDLKLSNKQNATKTYKGYVRKFNRKMYSKNNWICGCEEKNALFCFPCVLFGGDNSWTKKGVRDLVHIHDKMKTHENSKSHLHNIFSCSLLGKSNLLTQLNPAYRRTINSHNEQVDKNRYILNIIINCIRFSGALELALRGHDDIKESENKGAFRELINFSSQLDNDLKEHFSKATVFKGTSKTIQNELLECMFDVYHEEVTRELKESNYVSVIVDETTDVSNEFQLVIILRYIVAGKPVERFWNFVNPTGHDPVSIANSILNEIDPLISDTPNKLISQSYDGASLMNGGLNGVQKIIKDKYPLANYVYYYAHPINLILSNAASVIPSVRIFFAHLSGLCSFFSTSHQRRVVLNNVVHGSASRSSRTRWNFHSRGINTIYEYRKEIINVMEILENDKNIQQHSTIEQAGAYKLRLQDRDFIFWLAIFHKIMPHVDILFQQLQTMNNDPIKVKEDLLNFEKEIQTIRDRMNIIIINSTFDLFKDETVAEKKRRQSQSDLPFETHKKRETLEMCDSIVQQIKARFTFTGHLTATKFFLFPHYNDYKNIFPNQLLCEIVDVYPFLEKNRLKTELQVIYERKELLNISAIVSLLSLVSQEDMRCSFQETLKLLEVLVTTPMSTLEAERCFSILKRIKTFLRNSMKEERLSALGMLSAEKVFLNAIENFNTRVINKFANKKERRRDFTYRVSMISGQTKNVASTQPSVLPRSPQKSVLVPIQPPVHQESSETSVANLIQQELDTDIKIDIVVEDLVKEEASTNPVEDFVKEEASTNAVEDLVKEEASTDSFDTYMCKPSLEGTIEEIQDAPRIELNQLHIVNSIDELTSGLKSSTEERIEYINLDDSGSDGSERVDLTKSSSDKCLNSVTTPPPVQPTSSPGQHTTPRHLTSITSTNSMVLKYGGLFNHPFMDEVSVNKEQMILILNQLDIAFDSPIAQQCLGDDLDDNATENFNYGSNLDLFFDNITKIVKTLSPLDQAILQKYVTDRAFEMKAKQLKLKNK